jgi:hypothetical protein
MMILGGFFQKVKSILPEEVRKIIKEKSADEYCLLDVRQPGEYEQGHIPVFLRRLIGQRIKKLLIFPTFFEKTF